MPTINVTKEASISINKGTSTFMKAGRRLRVIVIGKVKVENFSFIYESTPYFGSPSLKEIKIYYSSQI